jgi:hypothetical protein
MTCGQPRSTTAPSEVAVPGLAEYLGRDPAGRDQLGADLRRQLSGGGHGSHDQQRPAPLQNVGEVAANRGREHLLLGAAPDPAVRVVDRQHLRICRGPSRASTPARRWPPGGWAGMPDGCRRGFLQLILPAMTARVLLFALTVLLSLALRRGHPEEPRLPPEGMAPGTGKR